MLLLISINFVFKSLWNVGLSPSTLTIIVHLLSDHNIRYTLNNKGLGVHMMLVFIIITESLVLMVTACLQHYLYQIFSNAKGTSNC